MACRTSSVLVALVAFGCGSSGDGADAGEAADVAHPSRRDAADGGDSVPIDELIGDSEIRGPDYADLLSALDAFAVEHSERVELVRYGESELGRALVALRIGPGHAGAPAALITGATHGNEYLHIVDRVPSWLVDEEPSPGRDAFFARSGAVFVVPVFNPDGYEMHRRRNASGIDLNRDFDQAQTGFVGFASPETSSFIAFLDGALSEGGLELQLAVDYHCCTPRGAMLRPWSYDPAVAIPAADMARFDAIAEMFLAHVAPDGLYGTPADAYFGRRPVGSSKDYYYTSYGTIAFTYEGRKVIEGDRLAEHVAFWDAALGAVAAGL
jgi:hypothetical protein